MPEIQHNPELPEQRNIESAEAFFDILEFLDKQLVEFEDRIGMKLDLFKPEFLAIFTNELSSFQTREDLKIPGLFSSRVVARQMINETGSASIQLREGDEDVILRSVSFVSSGFNWKVTNREISQEIVNLHKTALEQFHSMPQAPDLSRLANELAAKLALLNSYRAEHESSIILRKGMKELDVRMDTGLRTVVRDCAVSEAGANFFNHDLPYAIQSIAPLRGKEIADSVIQDESAEISGS